MRLSTPLMPSGQLGTTLDLKGSKHVIKRQLLSLVSLFDNSTNKSLNSFMKDFTIRKHFDVKIKHPKPIFISEVLWQSPLNGWIKVNPNDTTIGVHTLRACGGIFMITIKLAVERNWKFLWLETNSKHVVRAFTNVSIDLWHFQNCWSWYVNNTLSTSYLVIHIYREKNNWVDRLTSIDLFLGASIDLMSFNHY